MLRLVWLLPVGIALLSGCNQPAAAPQADKSAALAAEVKALRNDVDLLGTQILTANNRIQALESLRDTRDRTTAYLDPAARAYEPVDATLGTFAVSLADVRPFADGVKIKLNLGNLSAVTFNGAKVTVSYGSRVPTDGTKFLAWNRALQSKVEHITDRLLPGHWNPVQITLPGIQEKDFGYLTVKIETDQILLY